jgi:hypothetical protein
MFIHSEPQKYTDGYTNSPPFGPLMPTPLTSQCTWFSNLFLFIGELFMLFPLVLQSTPNELGPVLGVERTYSSDVCDKSLQQICYLRTHQLEAAVLLRCV